MRNKEILKNVIGAAIHTEFKQTIPTEQKVLDVAMKLADLLKSVYPINGSDYYDILTELRNEIATVEDFK